MKVLVTGAGGYIGSVTTEVLLDAGYEVIALDSLELGHREAIDPRATFVQADLRDRDATFAAFAAHRPEATLHFAAYSLVGESMEQPGPYFTNNLVGACNLFDAMLAHGCKKFVFSSSCTVYGQPETMPVTEDLPRKALNPYGQTKVMIEEMTEWHAKLSGLRAAILRYFNPAGATERCAEDRAHETHLVPLALAVALGKRERLTIFGTDYPTPDGTCVRDYIHVLDLAEAHVKALEALERESLIEVNVGTGTGYSVRQIIETVRLVTDHAVPATEGERRPGGADAPAVYADPTRAQKLLGWQATRSLEDMVRSAYEWRLRHPNGYAGGR